MTVHTAALCWLGHGKLTEEQLARKVGPPALDHVTYEIALRELVLELVIGGTVAGYTMEELVAKYLEERSKRMLGCCC